MNEGLNHQTRRIDYDAGLSARDMTNIKKAVEAWERRRPELFKTDPEFTPEGRTRAAVAEARARANHGIDREKVRAAKARRDALADLRAAELEAEWEEEREEF